MAEYKVAQDVEAEDKLIGPFSFRQFIYLIVVAVAIALAWGLSRIFIALAIIPLPVILFFGALALPLRKDQPMEIYLAALVSFLLKPRKRLWTPDGIDSLIKIAAPKAVDEHLIKDISEMETEKRLSYLADIADTGGWSIRHATQPVDAPNSSMNPDQYYAAQQTVDVLEDDGGIARNFDTMIANTEQERRQQIIHNMYNSSLTQPVTEDVIEAESPEATITPQYNPYPTIHQSVIQPAGYQSSKAVQNQYQTVAPQNAPSSIPPTTDQMPEVNTISTSEKPISTDIINLANNNSLSIETIQHEADRIKKKEDDSEVFISLH